jgi:hypothetical protein
MLFKKIESYKESLILSLNTFSIAFPSLSSFSNINEFTSLIKLYFYQSPFENVNLMAEHCAETSYIHLHRIIVRKPLYLFPKTSSVILTELKHAVVFSSLIIVTVLDL